MRHDPSVAPLRQEGVAPLPLRGGASSEVRALARLAWPIAVAQVGLVLMSLVDTAILGRTSGEDLAGAALGRNVAFAAQTFSIGMAMALEPLAAQALGARAPGRAWAALVATLEALAFLWAPALGAAYGLTLLLVPMGTPADTAHKAQLYLMGQAPGLFFFSVFLAGKTFLQAHGLTRPAVIAAVVANVVNVVVCNLLVRGDDALAAVHLHAVGLPRLGVFGAGLASSVGGLVLAGIVLGAARAVRPAERQQRVSVRAVVRIGTPVGLHMLAEIGVFALITLLTGSLGPTVVAAHQIALGLASLTFMGALGVSGATSVRVGRAIGANASPRGPGLLGIGMGATVMTVGAVAFAAIPRTLVGLFTHDQAVVELGATLLRIAALFQLFDGVQGVAAGALRGANDVRFTFLAGLICYWLVGLPVALGLAFGLGWGAAGLWWGLTAGLVSVAALLAGRFVWITRGGRLLARVNG